MVGIFLLQSFVEHRKESLISDQTPPLGVVIAGWCLAGKSLHDNVGTQSAQNLDKEVDILLHAPEAESLGVLVILLGKRCPTKKLQLVKLYGCERQRVNLCL